MHAPLDAMQTGFLTRIRPNRGWGFVAFQTRRAVVALGLVLIPALALLALVAWGPSELSQAGTSTQNVHETFARFISAVATASAIAVSVATLTLNRELKGIRTLTRRSRDNDAFRDRARIAGGRESMPTSLGAFCAATFETLAATSRRALARAQELGIDPRAEGVGLQEYLGTLAERAQRASRATSASRRHPNQLLHAAYDFEQELTAHYARRFARMEALPDDLRAHLDDVVARILDVATISKYAKTMNIQWGLSRMAMAITISSVPSLIAATAMTLLYGQGAVDALGRTGAGAIVAGALALAILPVGIFVSYVMRFVFLNQHTLPTEGFIVGPEAPDAVEHAWPGRARRSGRAQS